MIVMGKIESGCCRVGDQCVIMPNRNRVEVTNIYYEDMETDFCICGENVRLKLKNIDEDVCILFICFELNCWKSLLLQKILSGSVLCSIESEPCHVGKVFDAEVNFFDETLTCSVSNVYL